MTHGVSRGTPPIPAPPTVAAEIFGAQLPAAAAFAELLCTDAVVRGLIGPREVPRVWDRHLLNCALATPVAVTGATVADVGSGAGLPGIVWAIVRPDLRVTLIEPLSRRTSFLTDAVERLDLGDRVVVARTRAEDDRGAYDIVTSRAVAALDKLARWCLPLTRRGGAMCAIKGAGARVEVAAAARTLGRLGGGTPEVLTFGAGRVAVPTTVVRVPKA